MKRIEKVIVKPTYSPEYPVIIGEDVLDNACDIVENEIKAPVDKVVIFVQEPVNKLDIFTRLVESFREKYPTYIVEVPSGEVAKSLDFVLKYVRYLHEIQATRATLIVGVGGGALGDLVGFLSSIYLRGLPLVLVPTTLLSMVDSSIGGKNAVNLFEIKNVLGTFYQPKLVLEDLRFIDSLPERELRSGLAEVVKYGITINPTIVKIVESDVDKIFEKDRDTLISLVKLSVECKAWIVHLDEREERDVRQILNYGHTVGHGIEASARGALTHGECVMIGMIVESDLGIRLGYTDRSVWEKLVEISSKTGLPSRIPRFVEKKEVLRKIEYDKKRVGGLIKLPIVRRLGEFEILKMDVSKLISYLDNILEEYYERQG
ncbi:MAG: 3-dehydroquinate synthase [Crenarchaeota archaeon]|nr:3-dehydroquinate synthase [Thermoproteota archaeon]